MKKSILLIHGWSYKHYTGSHCIPYWEERMAFLDLLSISFDVKQIYLPGFCGVPEPNKPWSIEDFAEYIETWLKEHNCTPNIILGTSFGALVAFTWKNIYGKKTPILLVSPALVRATHKSLPKALINLGKNLPIDIVSAFRTAYLHLVSNQYYLKASSIMRETYRKIMFPINLTAQMSLLNEEELCFIFGKNDTATPPQLFLILYGKTPKNFHLLNCGHNVAGEKPEELVNIINKFSNN